MDRIPVTRILHDTYRFVFSNITTIFGLTWVSALLLEASELLFKQIESPDHPFAIRVATWLAAFAIYFLCYSVMAVAVARFAMSPSAGKVLGHFAIGRSEWRMFRSSIALALSASAILLLAVLTIAIVAVIITAASGLELIGTADSNDSPLSWFVAAGVIVSLFGGVAFIAVRYWFFLPLTAILAPDQWLGRSFDLSAGYFWPILGLVLGPKLIKLVSG